MGDWRLGSYELRRRLGEGGMAQVYLARDIRLGREVAVKVLDPKLAERPGFRERFMREARVAAALDHPNIVPLFDFDDKEALYLVMPYVSGGSLQDMLPKAPLPIGEVVTYGSQIADALEYAHQRNVVHRDVKPANMLVHADGRLMLSDFGLAKIVSSTQKLAAPRNRPDAGTPEYMAPEQVVGTSDSRSDIYGLGVVLYLLLTGRLPFSGSSSQEVMQAHLYKEPAPLRRYNPNVPAAMEMVVMRAMAKQPTERFQRASELGAALLSALIADNDDAPTFILGSPSYSGSHPTDQMPVVAPPVSDLSNETPPWRRQAPGGSAPFAANQAAPSSGQASGGHTANSMPNTSDWSARRPSSSLNEILPDLNMPFTSLEEAQRQSRPQQPSGAGPMGPFGSLGSQRSHSGYSGIHGSNPHPSGTDSQATGQFGLSSARTLGRVPLGQPSYPQAPFPFLNESAVSSPFGGQQMSGAPGMPYRPQPSAPMAPMDSLTSMAPMGGYGMAMTAEAPARTQPADLRATLPGSRMSEPPVRGAVRGETPREHRSWLWLIIALLLIVMIIAVIVLLHGLETPPSGALGSLFPL